MKYGGETAGGPGGESIMNTGGMMETATSPHENSHTPMHRAHKVLTRVEESWSGHRCDDEDDPALFPENSEP